jgi:hypothetical protein
MLQYNVNLILCPYQKRKSAVIMQYTGMTLQLVTAFTKPPVQQGLKKNTRRNLNYGSKTIQPTTEFALKQQGICKVCF